MNIPVKGIPRCQHVKVNGMQCGSPALREKHFCFFHQRWHERRVVINARNARRIRQSLALPILEDAESIQMAIMQVIELLLSNHIDQKTASLALNALRTASNNLRQARFQPDNRDVVIDLDEVDKTTLGDHVWDERYVRRSAPRPCLPPEPQTPPAEESSGKGPSSPGYQAYRKHIINSIREGLPAETKSQIIAEKDDGTSEKPTPG